MNPGSPYQLFDTLESALLAYTFVYLFFTFSFWALGKSVNSLLLHLDFTKSFWTGIFFEMFIGLAFGTIAFAVFATRGKTELLGMLLFGTAAFYWTRKEQPSFRSFGNQKSKHSLGILSLLSLLVFLPFAWFKVPFSANPYPGYMGDYLYYAEIAEFAFKTGNENIYAASNLFGPLYHGASPYHFFDIWLNSLISECTNLPYIATLESIVWAIYRLLVAVGLLAIVEKIAKINLGVVALCFLMLFFTGSYFSVFDQVDFLRFNNKLLQSVVDGKKIAASLIFFIGFYLLWIHKSPKSALCLLMAGCFASVGNVMGISAGVFAWGCVQLWKNEKKSAIFSISISLLGLAFVGIFYVVFGSGFPAINYIEVLKHGIEYPTSKVKFLTSYLITILVYNGLLWFFGAYLLFKSKLKPSLSILPFQAGIILFGTLLGGALAAAIFTGEFQDGDQFLMNVYVPVICLLVFITLIHLLQLTKISSILYKLILLGLAIYASWAGTNTYLTEKTNSKFWASNYSIAYLNKISSSLKDIKNPVGASINRISSDPFYHKKYYLYNPLGYYMKTMAKGYHTVGLSYFEICTQCPGFQFLCQRDRFAFYNYVYQLGQNDPNISIPLLQAKFIDDFHLEYLIVEAGAFVPNGIKNRLKLVAKDAVSGESFYLISPH